uniref:(northern house mosquito) hypothetical protein n=1 Tax=Culex pipiens TaxID=7175 RepID=A0A8D8ES10_CULPI
MNFSASCCLPIVGNRHLVSLPLGRSSAAPNVLFVSGSAHTDRWCGWVLPEPLFVFFIITGAAVARCFERSSNLSCVPTAAALCGVLVRAAVKSVDCSRALHLVSPPWKRSAWKASVVFDVCSIAWNSR